ncbi:TcfC E-set like domain-containing protein, partial [Francisellaceae bacterium]|nr:TcfC E-set like domain-containing protein [Francisellaceae bacterium]
FINPLYLVKQTGVRAKYLKDSTAGFSAINQFSNNLSGEDANNVAYSLNHGLVLGYGNWDIQSVDNLTYTASKDQNTGLTETDFIFQFQDLYARWRGNRYKARIGLQQTLGSIIIPQLNVFGVSFETDDKLLTNKRDQVATPIQVSMVTPSYVEVFRNQTLLDTQYFPPGNHFIDTSRLPDGAYQVQIRIRDIAGNVSNRSFFFVKTDLLPLSDQPEYYMSYGRLASLTSTDVFPAFEDLNLISLAAEQRIHKFFGLGEHISLFNYDEVLGELDLITQMPYVDFTISGAASNFGDYGAGFGITSTLSNLTVNTILRRIWVNENSGSEEINQYLEDTQVSNSNVGANISYDFWGYSVGLGLGYGYVDGVFGHTGSFNVSHTYLISADSNLNVELSASSQPENNLILLSFTWNFNVTPTISTELSLNGSYMQQNGDDTFDNSYVSAGVTKTWGDGADVTSYGISGNVAPKNQYISQNFITNNEYFSSNVNTDYVFDDSGQRIFYNLNLYSENAYTATSNFDWESMQSYNGVMVRVDAPKPSKFSVFTGKKLLKEIEANKGYFIPLPEFASYKIQVVSDSGSLTVLNPEQEITIYDGNVHTLYWEAKEAFLLIGTVVTPEGDLVAEADVTGALNFGQTDEDGFTQVEAIIGSKLSLKASNGLVCTIDTNTIEPEDGIAYEDEIVCVPE